MVTKRKERLYAIRRKLKRAGFKGLVRYKADLAEIGAVEYSHRMHIQGMFPEKISNLLDEFCKAGGQIQYEILNSIYNSNP